MFIAGTITDADECQWYCLTFVVDATVGTAINLVLLTCFEQQVQRNPNCSVMKFGEYGDPPQLSIWFPQLMVWLGIVVVAKVITLLLLFQFLAPLDVLISAIFAIFHGHPELELVTVMIVIPTIMNIMQFWVTDTFLKRQPLSGEDGADSDLDEELISGVSCVLRTGMLSSSFFSECGYCGCCRVGVRWRSITTGLGRRCAGWCAEAVPEVRQVARGSGGPRCCPRASS